MKINLRKAHALQGLIIETISSGRKPNAVTVGKFDDPLATVNEAVKEHKAALAAETELLHVLYVIRKKQDKASSECGIPDILADKALLTKLNVAHGLYSTSQYIPSTEQIAAMHEDMKNYVPKNQYDRPEKSFSVALVTKEEAAQHEASIKANAKKIREFDDRLLDLNVKVDIELDEKDVEVLKRYSLI